MSQNTMNFAPRRSREAILEVPFNERLSDVLDKEIARRADAEYKAGRGSGNSDVAQNRIGSGYIGMECIKQLAYKYHKTPPDPDARDRSTVNPGELNRHAKIGHWTEAEMAEWLRWIGFDLLTHELDENGNEIPGYDGNPKQIGYKAAYDEAAGQYRMAGELDGLIVGVPEAFKDLPTPCIWESKKATNKKFNKFVKEGVQKADAKYYGQVQINMAYMGHNITLFSMMNCDNMKFYFERIPLDVQYAQQLSDRAVRVMNSSTPEEFPRIGKERSDWRCRFCEWADHCYAQEEKERHTQERLAAPQWLKK